MTNQSKKCFMSMNKQQRGIVIPQQKKQNISGVIMLKFPWQQKVS